MFNLLKAHHPVRHVTSFKYAFNGIFHVFLNEPNYRVQLAITLFSIILGAHFKISTQEWALLTLALGFLLAAEMMNTVVEEVIDNLIHDHHEGARVIKDVSAGFVLTAALTVLVILYFIFGHRLFV